MKRVSVFVYLLLAVVLAEVGVLLYDGLNNKPAVVSKNVREIVVSEANAQIPATEAVAEDNRPLFERNSAAEIESQLSEIEASLKRPIWFEEITNLSENREVASETSESSEIKENAAPVQEVTEEVVAEVEPVTEVAEEIASVAEPVAIEETVNAEEPLKVEEPVAQETEKVVQTTQTQNNALVAVVIDDIGLSVPFSKEIAKFNKPLTVSFLPYGAANKKQAQMLKDAGFEVMLHIPMMPHVPANLAPVTLSPEMDKREIQDDLQTMLTRFEGVGMMGVNNHMGSLFTEKEPGMRYVMEFLKKNNLYFFDSRTTAKSVGKKIAAEYGVPFIERDVFLDNERDYNYIMGQFKKLESIAKKKGYAIAIGHPYGQTLKALKDWSKGAEERGISLVKASTLLGRKSKR